MAKENLHEVLAREFIHLIGERYPTPEKLMRIAIKMGFRDTAGQIVIITQFRNAIKSVSPRLYQSIQHRDDLYDAIIETLEELEDRYEDEQEEYEEYEEEEEGEGVT